MSQALPYWDDAPQPQSQSPQPQQYYTEEEAQELVEKAYQEGWQLGMEEGYKLGKDKGYKEYKVQIEENEAKKTKNRVSKAIAGYQDARDTLGNITSVDVTPEMDSAAPEACKSIRTTHTTTTSPNSTTTTTKRSESSTVASRSPTSSIPPIYSSPTWKAKIIEIINSAAHNSHISSNSTKTPHLTAENPSDNISDIRKVSVLLKST